MEYDLICFGEKIKEIRLANGLRQKDVTELVGINRDTLRKIEGGKSLPKIDTLDQLSYVYKRDLYSLFSKYRINIDNYITKKMKLMSHLFRNYNYDQITAEATEFYDTFIKSKFYTNTYIQKKMNQFKTYLICLANIEDSFSDKGREVITGLFVSLDYSQNDLKNKLVRLDKLEIRIIMLLTTIYRYRDEFISTIELLETILHEVTTFYRDDKEFLYFYILVVLNLMTFYHRMDEHKKIESLYKDSLAIFEDEFSIHNLSYYLIRVGINKHYIKDHYSNDFVNVGLSLLKDHIYLDKYNKHKDTLKNMYSFLELYDN